MHRYLLVINNFRIPSYGVMMIIAYLTAIWVASKESKRRGVDPFIIQSLSIWIIVGLIIGARIWYVWENWGYFSENIIEIFKLWEGGMVFYGGFIGGFIGGILYIKMNRFSIWKFLDIMAPGIAIAIGTGRIGCFLNGCCFGKVTDSWIGIRFPAKYFPPVYWTQLKRGLISSGASHTLPVIPTQLISTMDLLVIFGLLWWIRKRTPFKGFLFSLFLGLYGLHRFIIDFFRYYEGNALMLNIITLSQFVSILMMLLSIGFIIHGYRRKKAQKSKNSQFEQEVK